MRKFSHLQVSDWLSAREALELFHWFLRWGQHNFDDLRKIDESETERILEASGYPFRKVIQELQKNPHAVIPLFENIMSGNSFKIEMSPGVSAVAHCVVDGVDLPGFEVRNGSQLRLDHQAKFESACRYRDMAIKSLEFEDIYSMLVAGISSIESYINMRVYVYQIKTGVCIVKDIDKDRTPLKKKIMEWMPIMVKEDRDYIDYPGLPKFEKLTIIRNDNAIHYKIGRSINYLEEAAAVINDFRMGIAGLMVALNQSFGEELTTSMIRAMLYPSVYPVYPPTDNR